MLGLAHEHEQLLMSHFKKANYYSTHNIRFQKRLGVEQLVQLNECRKKVLGDNANSETGSSSNQNDKSATNDFDAANAFIHLLQSIAPDWEDWPGFPSHLQYSSRTEFAEGKTAIKEEAVSAIVVHFFRSKSKPQSCIQEKAARIIQAMYRSRLKKQQPIKKQQQIRLCQFWERMQKGVKLRSAIQNGKVKGPSMLWIDPGGNRVCIGTKAGDDPSIGIDMIDLSEVRIPKESDDNSTRVCLIGTERTIDMHISSGARDQLVNGFHLLLDYVQVHHYRFSRHKWTGTTTRRRHSGPDIFEVEALFIEGIPVSAFPTADRRKAAKLQLSISDILPRLYLNMPHLRPYDRQGLNINDITEIRTGYNTYSLKSYGAGLDPLRVISIVGAERTLSFELKCHADQSLMLRRLLILLRFYSTN